MSTLTLLGTKSAIGLGNTASFLGTGGVPPYVYTVLPGGQEGTINSLGIYSSPTWSTYNSNPANASDTVQVTDSTGATATACILVGPPLVLFCDVISTALGIPRGRVVLYNQKIFQPKDPGLFISVGIASVKVFANSYQFDPNTASYNNFCNCMATLDVHVISVDNSALMQKELVMMSLMSPYAISQQNANAFSIGRIPPGGSFNDLSEIDGPEIPFHYHFSIAMQYSVPATVQTDIYTSFQNVVVVPNA